jgi:hypothetical protein
MLTLTSCTLSDQQTLNSNISKDRRGSYSREKKKEKKQDDSKFLKR